MTAQRVLRITSIVITALSLLASAFVIIVFIFAIVLAFSSSLPSEGPVGLFFLPLYLIPLVLEIVAGIAACTTVKNRTVCLPASLAVLHLPCSTASPFL